MWLNRFVQIGHFLTGMLLLGSYFFAFSTPAYAAAPGDCSSAGSVNAVEECERRARESAGDTNSPDDRSCKLDQSILGLPTWYKYLESNEDESGRCSPVLSSDEGGLNSVQVALPIGLTILEGMLRLGGLIAVVMVFIGAFRFITSQGNPDSAAAARKTIINALIGLTIVIISTAVVSYIGRNLG